MIVEAYRKYKAAGLTCLPIKKGDKTPAMSTNWKLGCDDESLYQHGIGIVCGKISGGVECIDFDNHFSDADKVVGAFLTGDVLEIYNRTFIILESTMSGGFHILYRCSEVGGNQKLAQRAKAKNGGFVPDTIIETRGEGGYFVCAPTPGYKLVEGSIENIPTITPEERKVLLDSAKAMNEWRDKKRDSVKDYEDSEMPGDYYNKLPESIDDLKAALVRHGWKQITDKRWRRPGKDKGISATLGYVADNVFYCWSENGYPFEIEKCYNPFGAIALLDYNGDHSAFAKELAERYNLGRTKERSANNVAVKKEDDKTETELDGILRKAFINLDVPIPEPPIVVRILDKEGTSTVEKRLLTLGNFSCITGKSKSKKTFLTSVLLSSAVKNGMMQGKIVSSFKDNKRICLLFDTEQSGYDAFVTAARVPSMIGSRSPNFRCFDLREHSPAMRCEIIGHALERFNKSVGYVVIDGIADLAKAINDEEEASRVVSLLMKWTKVYNCHITTVIHQNKNDNYATGHLGSAIIKKSECVMSVSKVVNDFRRSTVSCDLIRGTGDFKDFDFYINNDSLPEVIHNDEDYEAPF